MLSADDLMRKERHGLLIENVDIPMRNYLHSGKAIPQSLLDYRQELLDIPQNNTPK